MRKFIVNNTEVEYLHVEEKPDGTMVVHFEEKFNLVNAHMSVIMQRLRDNGIDIVHITKYLHKRKIICILMKNIDQLPGVLHALDIPYGCYEVNYQDAVITLDIPEYEKLISAVNIASNKNNGAMTYE